MCSRQDLSSRPQPLRAQTHEKQLVSESSEVEGRAFEVPPASNKSLCQAQYPPVLPPAQPPPLQTSLNTPGAPSLMNSFIHSCIHLFTSQMLILCQTCSRLLELTPGETSTTIAQLKMEPSLGTGRLNRDGAGDGLSRQPLWRGSGGQSARLWSAQGWSSWTESVESFRWQESKT